MYWFYVEEKIKFQWNRYLVLIQYVQAHGSGVSVFVLVRLRPIQSIYLRLASLVPLPATLRDVGK